MPSFEEMANVLLGQAQGADPYNTQQWTPNVIKKERAMQSDNIDKLSDALAKAQGIMKAAVYNKVNPHFKNKYADLAAVWDAIREPLSKNGLSVTQTIQPLNGSGLYLHTTLRHSTGQWVTSVHPLPAGAKPQEMGSALTYARRYSLSAMVGIAADEDDDANTANKAHDAQQPITPEQVEHLKILIEATESDVPKLLAYIAKLTKLSIEKLEDIPQSQYEDTFKLLNRKPKKEVAKS